MLLTLLTLLIAMFISAVSAYYSILGLVSIFAAASLPVIVMGSGLEAGKNAPAKKAAVKKPVAKKVAAKKTTKVKK